MRIRVQRDWPWLLALGAGAYFLLARGVITGGRVMRTIGRKAEEFWSRLPWPSNKFDQIAEPTVEDWDNSPAQLAWRGGWFDSYRVHTVSEGKLNGYLEFRQGVVELDGQRVGGIWGYPVSLLYLGEAMSRVSSPGVWKFSLVPEQVVNSSVLSELVNRHSVWKALFLGTGFVFADKVQAARVIRRLEWICVVQWLTTTGWFRGAPFRDRVQQVTVPFLFGTFVEVDPSAAWAVNLGKGEGESGAPPISDE